MQEKRPRSTTISSTTVSSMPPGAPGALPVLPLGMCWQLQDGPDYHLSWGRGQGRLRRCGGVLWAFKRRKCVEIAKRALLAHLGLEHALCWHRPPLRRACVAPYRLWRAVTLTLRGLYSSVSFKYTCAHSQTHEQTTCPAPQLARRSSQSSLHSKAPAAGSVAWWRGSSRHLPHARHRRTRNRSAADWEGLGAAGLADQRGGTSDGEPARQIATMSGV